MIAIIFAVLTALLGYLTYTHFAGEGGIGIAWQLYALLAIVCLVAGTLAAIFRV